LQKLYGHGYEIFSLASDQRGSLIASSCKAAKAEHAQVITRVLLDWIVIDNPNPKYQNYFYQEIKMS